jgi:hypothetical protein
MQPGSQLTEDYSAGQGMNDAIAFGGASTDATTTDETPYAEVTAEDLNGRPKITYSWSPDDTVTDTGVLALYASQAVSSLQDGSKAVSLCIANNIPGKVLGDDWFLGDDIGWAMSGLAFPDEPSGVVRVIGYQLDYTTITPILAGTGMST